MATFKSFKQALSKIDSAVITGSVRALNKAIKSTKTKVVKDLKADTKLKTDYVKSRVRTKKGTRKDPNGSVNIATKFDVSLDKFQPKLKKVKVSGIKKPGQRGRPKSRTYMGVTAKIGNQPRQLIPGGFIMELKGKDIVAGRAGAYVNGEYVKNNAPKYKTKQLKSSVFTDSIKARHSEATKYLADAYKKVFDHEVKYAISKLGDNETE